MGFVMDGLESESYDRLYTDRQLFKRIGSYFKPWRKRIIAIVIILVLASISEFTSFLVIAKSLDAVVSNQSLKLFILLGLAIALFGALEWTLNFFRQFLSSRVVGETIYKLRSDVFLNAIKHDLSFFDEHPTGKVVSRISTDTEDFANIIALFVDFFSQLTIVLILIIYLSVLSFPLALILICMAPVAVIIALSFRKIARFVSLNAKRVTAEVNSQIQESVAGISVAKGFRREASLWNNFKSANKLAYRYGLRKGVVLQFIFPLMNLASGIGTGLVAFYGGLLTQNNGLSLGNWFLFMQAIGAFWWPMLNVASFWSQLQDGLAASERVFSLIDRESKVKQISNIDDNPIMGHIAFKNVKFMYSSKEVVLDNFSLTIPSSEKLAIVGKTGAGKSSIVKLICRFYEFQEGQIEVDSKDIRSYSLDHLRSNIGLVSQDPFLFPGTVADNIRYGKPDASDSEVEEAARSLGRGDWVDDLSMGLKTETGHRGSSLSMGQRQLVVLARVLLRNPKIFILDEATASIDPFTESQIQDGLKTLMMGRTAIVIAHRLSTVKFSDRILVLDKGKIIEEGNHETLLAKKGQYASLYDTYFKHQSLDYIEKQKLEA